MIVELDRGAPRERRGSWDLFALGAALFARAVVTVRGVPGVAAADGPAVIVWTEHGIAYRLASPTRTTAELIAIADELR